MTAAHSCDVKTVGNCAYFIHKCRRHLALVPKLVDTLNSRLYAIGVCQDAEMMMFQQFKTNALGGQLQLNGF